MMSFKKIILLFTLALLAGIFSGCATFSPEQCPYIINDLKMELGEKNDQCKYAGAYFSLFNDSEKAIRKISISFMIYDENGENPFLGSNKIVTTAEIKIPPSEAADIAVSLDKFLSIVPESPYEIDFFYIREIIYEDNSKWEDYFGIFAGNSTSLRSADHDIEQ